MSEAQRTASEKTREFGYVNLRKRGNSLTVTIPPRVRDFAGHSAGRDFDVYANPADPSVWFIPKGTPAAEAAPGIFPEALGMATIRAADPSLYLTLSADALALLAVQVDDRLAIKAASDGTFALAPW